MDQRFDYNNIGICKIGWLFTTYADSNMLGRLYIINLQHTLEESANKTLVCLTIHYYFFNTLIVSKNACTFKKFSALKFRVKIWDKVPSYEICVLRNALGTEQFYINW